MRSWFPIERLAFPSEDEYCDYSKGGPWWTCKPDGLHVERFAKMGAASREGCEPTTLPLTLKKAGDG